MVALLPPVEPMLARLARELPDGDEWTFEPKWDGFRCLLFRDGAAVQLFSRNQRPLGRYFPEVAAAAARLPGDFVLDGELLVVHDGRFDFAALMSRLHPAASRVELLSRTTPATFVAFDLLALGDEALLERPFEERRRRLEQALQSDGEGVLLSPATDDRAVAEQWLTRYSGRGVDGVVAKSRGSRYEPGRRVMVKVKPERTAECVVAGFRWLADAPLVSSLLLGLYDDDDGASAGTLRHVGVVSSFTRDARASLASELAPLGVPLAGHPWEHGFALEGGPMGRLKGAAGRWTPDLEHDWVPLPPELVCEVAFDQVDGRRFRHPARFRRWRPDRDARTCRIEQLDAPDFDAVEVLAV